MGSIQFKKLKTGGKIYYVVEAHGERRKWIKAGTLGEARKLKRQLESLEKAQRIEELGIVAS